MDGAVGLVARVACAASRYSFFSLFRTVFPPRVRLCPPSHTPLPLLSPRRRCGAEVCPRPAYHGIGAGRGEGGWAREGCQRCGGQVEPLALWLGVLLSFCPLRERGRVWGERDGKVVGGGGGGVGRVWGRAEGWGLGWFEGGPAPRPRVVVLLLPCVLVDYDRVHTVVGGGPTFILRSHRQQCCWCRACGQSHRGVQWAVSDLLRSGGRRGVPCAQATDRLHPVAHQPRTCAPPPSPLSVVPRYRHPSAAHGHPALHPLPCLHPLRPRPHVQVGI